MKLVGTARAFLSLLCLLAGACTAAQELGQRPAAESNPVDPGSLDASDPTSPPADGKDSGTPSSPPPATKPPPATASLKWTARASMPTRRSRLGAVFGQDGKLYAIGGSTDFGPTGVVEVYDTALDSWSTAAPMPTARYGFSALLLPDGKIFTIGGDWDTSTSTDGSSVNVEIYNPATNTWTAGPPLPEGRYMGAGAVRADGSILFGGGYNRASNHARASVYILAPGATTWSVGSPMTSPRSSVAMAAGTDGTTYAFGGNDGAGGFLASAEARGPSAAGFSTLPVMPDSRGGGHSAVRGKDGRIYVIGGGSVPVLIFDPVPRTWSTGPVPPTCTGYAATATAPDGTIYALGGEPGMYINDVIALTK